MPHDLIDNRSEKLLDTILTTLPGAERARELDERVDRLSGGGK